PLPDIDRIVFTVVQTYSDGAVVRWADPPAGGAQPPGNPAVVLTLVPAAATEGHAHTAGESAGFGTLWAALLSAVVTRLVRCGWLVVAGLWGARRASR